MRKFGLLLIGALAAALLAAACGDDDDGGGSAATPTSNATGAATPIAASTPAAAAATVRTATHPTLGTILADGQGRALYMFRRDDGSTSNCYDNCATIWPPFLLPTGAPAGGPGVTGRLGTTDRRDGTKQVTYDGKPLYYYAQDTAPGDAKGQNVGSVWFVIQIGGSATGAPTRTAGSPTAGAAAPDVY